MGLDRRLIAILFHNGINDVTKVEKYIGRKDDYLEVIIDGHLEKLKIPGVIYPEDIPSVEYLETKIEELEKNFDVLEKMEEIKEEEFSFDAELEKTEIENKEILKSIKKEKPKTEKKSEKKKTKIVEPKELDNEIDDFIDSV